MTTPLAFRPEPPVIKWFKVYAGVLSVIYFLVLVLGFFILMSDPAPGDTTALQRAVGLTIFFGVVGLLLAAFVVGLFLQPRPWVWIYDLVLIVSGFTSCLTLPFSIALLIFWLKPETKAYFGR